MLPVRLLFATTACQEHTVASVKQCKQQQAEKFHPRYTYVLTYYVPTNPHGVMSATVNTPGHHRNTKAHSTSHVYPVQGSV